MNSKHHVRSSSHGRKVLPPHLRPSKPPPILKRGASYTYSHGQSGSVKKAVQEPSTAAGQDEDESEDMASFLQFCATCERQIVTPGASILYCSERCRKNDVSNPQSHMAHHSPPLLPTNDMPLADIVPQRSPTMLRPLSLTFSELSAEDPTSPVTEDEDCKSHDCEAGQYASQFYPGTWSSNTASGRPRLNRASTATDSSGLPSLIHSPSSSVASATSVAPTRPLPSRRNKSYSAYSTQSIDLVTPCTAVTPSSPTQLMEPSSMKSTASTLTAFRVAEGADLSYHRQSEGRRGSEAQSSLKQLFSHEAMKAPPTQASQLARFQ